MSKTANNIVLFFLYTTNSCIDLTLTKEELKIIQESKKPVYGIIQEAKNNSLPETDQTNKTIIRNKDKHYSKSS